MLRFPKIVIGAAAGAALFMLGIMSGHAQVGPQESTTPSTDTSRQLELLGKVLDIVRSDYVDKPDDGKLLTSAINGVLGALDPHSSYMDEKSYRDMRAETSGQFGGLGMQVNMEDGLLKVVSPIDDTPAAKAGILAGDVITPGRRHADQRPHPEPGGGKNARCARHRGSAGDHAQGPGGAAQSHADPARSSRSARCASRSKATTSDTSGSPSSTAARRTSSSRRSRPWRRKFRRISSRATFSTCATIRAACWIRRFGWPARF